MTADCAPRVHSNVVEPSPNPSGQVNRHSTTRRPLSVLPLATNTLMHSKHSDAPGPKHSLHSGSHSEHVVPFDCTAVSFPDQSLKVPLRHSCKGDRKEDMSE